jgi:membrane associated rhomboid family serine protease
MWFTSIQTPFATLALIAVTTFISVRAFKDKRLRDRLIFNPQAILADKEVDRLFTSAFLHADWTHLLFNMVTVLMFGENLELGLGIGRFLLIYFSSVVGGGLLSLYLHRHHDYYALGASGGACGLIFASIFLHPGGEIGNLFFQIGIPAWLYAILFLFAEFHGARTQRDNIGHDAHLGGAIIGLLTITAMYPFIVRQSPWLYATVMTLSLAMFVYFWKNPMFLPLSSFFGSQSEDESETRKHPADRRPTDEEVDAVLDKIAREGLQSLSPEEQDILKAASGE